jgi:hypothetical protein
VWIHAPIPRGHDEQCLRPRAGVHDVPAGGYAVTKGLAKGAKEGAIALDKAGHQALEKAKEYEQKKAIEACHKMGAEGKGGGSKRRASLSVALVDGVAIALPPPGGAMAAMPEGMELKVIDGVPVAVPQAELAPPAIGIAVDFEEDDV